MEGIHFDVVRGEDGKSVRGFELTGNTTEAESYCLTLPTVVRKGTGKVEIQRTRVTFTHPGTRYGEIPELGIYSDCPGGIVVKDLPFEDARELARILDGRGKYKKAQLKVSRLHAWQKGFRLVAEKREPKQ